MLIDPVSEPKGQREELEWFASTGHTIRGIFLDYWTSNGGAVQFGYPLTEEFVEVTSQDPDNKQLKYQATQYFEHALFTRQAEALQSDENGSEIQTQTPTQTQVKVVAQSGISGKHVLQQSGYATGRYPLFGYASDFSWLSGEMELYGGLTCLAQTCPCAYFSYDQGKSLVQFADRTWWSYAGWGQLDPTVGQHLVVFGRLANTKERPEINCPSGELPVLYIVRHAQMNPMP